MTIQSIISMNNEQIKKETLELLSNISKNGRNTNKLQTFLQESDYFIAPASRRYHMSIEGGLARHNLHVYSLVTDLHKLKCPDIAADIADTISVYNCLALISVCHDLCKVGFYKKSDESSSTAQQNFARDLFKGKKLNPEYQRNKEFCSNLIGWAKGGFEGPEPLPQTQWEIKDEFPLGHGTKSVLIASRYIDLTDEELLAIKWHSGSYECSEMERKAYETALRQTPLVSLLYAADYLACFAVEGFMYGHTN